MSEPCRLDRVTGSSGARAASVCRAPPRSRGRASCPPRRFRGACMPLRRGSMSRTTKGRVPFVGCSDRFYMSSSARGETAMRHGAAQDVAPEDRHVLSVQPASGKHSGAPLTDAESSRRSLQREGVRWHPCNKYPTRTVCNRRIRSGYRALRRHITAAASSALRCAVSARVSCGRVRRGVLTFP